MIFSSVQSLSHVQLFATPLTAAHQASLSITNSWSLFKLMSIELVMPSNHLILCAHSPSKKTYSKYTPPPPPTLPSSSCRVPYLGCKYSSLTSGRPGRGRGDTRGRCRTHFQPGEVRGGMERGGWTIKPIRTSSLPISHHPQDSSPTRKSPKGSHPRPLNATMDTRDAGRDPVAGFIMVLVSNIPLSKMRGITESRACCLPHENGRA